MKKKKWIWTAGAILLVLSLILGFQWLSPSFSAQSLTEEEANTLALAKYPGDIINTTKNEDEYQIKMQLETGLYFIKIDAKNGNVLSLELLEKNEEVTQIEQPEDKGEAHSDESIQENVGTQNETAKLPKSTVITVQQAIDIAANHLKGTADDDVKFHQPLGQTPYYLVEVEIENSDNDREAVVQVDAYTGEVKSVNWDD